MEIKDWPKPYRWMVEGLIKAKRAEAHYLTALDLFCYTKIIGRNILKFRNPKKIKTNSKTKNVLIYF